MKPIRSRHFSGKTALFLFLSIAAAGAVISQSIPDGPQPSDGAWPAVRSEQAEEPPAKLPSSGPTQPEIGEPVLPVPLSRRIVQYHIEVQLDQTNKTLDGRQSLTWTNPGRLPVSDLYFHLYPNAFQSMDSTFMKESGGKLRNDVMVKDSFGSMAVTSVKTAGGNELIGSMKYVQPDDGNPQDRTLMKIHLPAPVQPHGKVTLNMSFQVKLPAVFARMGYFGDFTMAGQWFPKIAVYEPAGTRGRQKEGWNLHQYHGNSEFYADFGIYNVLITVPANDIVAATGSPTGPAVTKNGVKTYHFYAEDVHDFAWSASPNFLYAEEPYSNEHIPGVKIKLYLDPSHAQWKDRYFAAAKKSLSDYSRWYGDYPYSTLSIVVPPQEANGAGGMEYPTLVTAWGAGAQQPDLELERVVVHEIGHQYWYGMVASNEFEEAWLDEGFTSYAEDRVMAKEYDVRSNLPVEASYITSPYPLNLEAWKYGGHDHYSDNVYIRAKLVLTGIEKQIGEAKMDKAMRLYFNRWKFKHPGTADFQRALEEATGRSWKEYFDQFIYGGMMVDYAVESISSQPIEQNGRTVYENTVKISRRAGYNAPVPIQFHFSDQSTVHKLWDGQEAGIQYRMSHTAPLDWVAIDPHYSLTLENKHINNFMRAAIDPKWKIRWNLGSVKIIEALIGWIGW